MVMKRPLHLFIGITLAALVGLQGIAKDTLHQWTDIQGRIIRASFVKADDKAVTVRLQGAQSMIRSADLSTLSLSPRGCTRGAPRARALSLYSSASPTSRASTASTDTGWKTRVWL